MGLSPKVLRDLNLASNVITFLLDNDEEDDLNGCCKKCKTNIDKIKEITSKIDYKTLWYSEFKDKPKNIKLTNKIPAHRFDLVSQVEMMKLTKVGAGCSIWYFSQLYKIPIEDVRNIERGLSWKLANAIYRAYDKRDYFISTKVESFL